MQSLIITLREGIEAALVVGIILTYLSRTKQDYLKRNVYWGVGISVALSILVAVVFQLINFDPENEVLEGTMFLIAGIFVLSLIIWMNKTSKNMGKEINERLDAIVEKKKGQALGIFLFTVFMVFREGVETVIFIFTLASGSSTASSIIGAVFGIILAAAFAYIFIKGSSGIDISRLFKVLNIILYLLVIRLFAGTIHEFGEVQFIPLKPAAASIIGFIVRDNSLLIVSIILVTIPLLMMVFSKAKKDFGQLAGVDKRRRLAELNLQRNFKIAAITLIVIMDILLGYEFVGAVTKKVIDPIPLKIEVVGGVVKVPVANLGDRILNKFSYVTDDNVNIRFMLIKRADGTIGSGFDSCLVCGSKKGGYYQEQGDTETVICKNCNAPIPIPTIGFPGGCNPVELKYEIENDNVVIKEADLLAQKKDF
ncbi:MAG: hypothetical protein A2Y23_09295 [Clostridiales bacterium GWB2_37_7]|nr:MAG: hypothetical protein A2Y23_09295 [Clostridiales bacterium GWB2_37_7]